MNPKMLGVWGARIWPWNTLGGGFFLPRQKGLPSAGKCVSERDGCFTASHPAGSVCSFLWEVGSGLTKVAFLRFQAVDSAHSSHSSSDGFTFVCCHELFHLVSREQADCACGQQPFRVIPGFVKTYWGWPLQCFALLCLTVHAQFGSWVSTLQH